MTTGAHDKEIGAEGACPRQQKLTHFLSAGLQAPHLYLRTESRQAAFDVCPRRLSVTLLLPLIVNDQDFYNFCTSKQGT